MTITEFLKKHKKVFSLYTLEVYARIPQNTISHAIGREKRIMQLAYEDALYKQLEEIEADLSSALVDYWQKHKAPVIAKKLSLKNGTSGNRTSKPKRQA